MWFTFQASSGAALTGIAQHPAPKNSSDCSFFLLIVFRADFIPTFLPSVSSSCTHLATFQKKLRNRWEKKPKHHMLLFFFHRFKFALSGNTLTQMCMWRTKGWILIIYTRLNSTCVQKGHECDLWEITVMDMFTLYHSAIKTIDRKQQQWK